MALIQALRIRRTWTRASHYNPVSRYSHPLSKVSAMTTAQDILATVSTGDVTRVKELLAQAPFLINAKDGAGRTPLSVAAWCGHTAVAELLLAHGADVNVRDRYGWTPLREADCRDRTAVAALLRQHGARE